MIGVLLALLLVTALVVGYYFLVWLDPGQDQPGCRRGTERSDRRYRAPGGVRASIGSTRSC